MLEYIYKIITLLYFENVKNKAFRCNKSTKSYNKQQKAPK